MSARRRLETNAIEKAMRAAVDALALARRQADELAAGARAERERLAALLDSSPAEKERRAGEIAAAVAGLTAIVERAEQVTDQVNVAMAQLAEGLQRMSDHWEGMKARYPMGERVIKAQEDERRRVAREIHDGPAQALANAVLRAEICERMMRAGRAEAVEELGRLKEMVKDSLRELRSIIFNLRPMALDDLGLIPTLRRYLHNLREHEGTPVHFHVAGTETPLPAAVEVAIFRLVQEAVNNARKHAHASLIQVRIEFTARRTVLVVVEDDGVGFDVTALKGAQWASFGLLSMEERIKLLDGELEVLSAPGQGTRVVAELSVVDREAVREQADALRPVQ